MIHKIRPYQLFSKLGSDNHAHLVIPNVPGRESLTIFSLETLILISAARLVKAKSLLEVGTSQGWTSMHLAMNTIASVVTLDIVDRPKAYSGKSCEYRIEQIIGTVQSLPQVHFDMVFIDADHSYEAVKADTESALQFSPKLIAWHDYDNLCEPGVSQWLDEFAATRDVFHIEDSWICLWLSEGVKEILL